MTKKKKNKRRSNGGDDDGVEFAVARILVQLRHTIAESESRRRRKQHRFRFTFDWSVKRKRSALNPPPSLPPFPPPPQQPRTAAVAAATASIACKSDGTSPTTPFSFISPSESDDKQQHHHHLELSSKSSIQQQQGRKREELLEMVNELTQCGILLKQEVEPERYRHKKLKAINTELKLKKNELVCGVKLKPNIETNEILNLIIPKFDTVNQHQHQNHTRHKQQQQQPQQPPQQQQKHYSLYNNNARDFATANTRRVLTTAAAAITGIPDLNVSANDTMTSIEFLRFQQHYDFRANLINKAMVAAEARKKRRQIYKAKNRTTTHK